MRNRHRRMPVQPVQKWSNLQPIRGLLHMYMSLGFFWHQLRNQRRRLHGEQLHVWWHLHRWHQLLHLQLQARASHPEPGCNAGCLWRGFRSRYTGFNCQNRINLCDSSPCRNGATCQDHSTHYTCHCPSGYTGKNCGEYVDWCATDPCENQATCHQMKNQYQCACGPGWTGKVCDVEMVSCQDAAARKGTFTKFFFFFLCLHICWAIV